MHTKAIKWYMINQLQLIIHVKKKLSTVYTLFCLIYKQQYWLKLGVKRFLTNGRWGHVQKTCLETYIHSFDRLFVFLYTYFMLFIADDYLKTQ